MKMFEVDDELVQKFGAETAIVYEVVKAKLANQKWVALSKEDLEEEIEVIDRKQIRQSLKILVNENYLKKRRLEEKQRGYREYALGENLK